MIFKALIVRVLFSLVTIFYLGNIASAKNIPSILYDLGLPVVVISIGGEEKNVLLDTGAANLTLSLTKTILQKHASKTSKSLKSKDLLGKIHQTPIWNLKEVTFEDINLKDVEVLEYAPWGLDMRNERTPISQVKIDGVMGLNFFKDRKVILDFSQDSIKIVKSFPEELTYQNWMPFSDEFEFSTVIDNISLRAVLDTGCSLSFIKPASVNHSFQVILGNFLDMPGDKPWRFVQPKSQTIFKPIKDPWRIFIMDFQEPDVDLMIGMDTLKGKRLLIDFTENKFLID